MENWDALLTIKAFAEAAGRSQQTIYKQISTRLSSYVHEKDGHKYIERRALTEVFKIGEIQPIQPKIDNSETTIQPGLKEEIEFLRKQLEAKDRQIEAQQQQISQLTSALENTTSSLKAAQALHAGTMQKQLESGSEEGSAADEVVVSIDEPKKGAWQRLRKWWKGDRE